MKRFLFLAAVGCFSLTASVQAQSPAPMPPAPPAMGTAAPVQGVVTGGCGQTAVAGGCGTPAACGEAYGYPAGCGANSGVARHDSRFGWHPVFHKLAFWKRDNSCGTGGSGLFSRLKGMIGGNRGGCDANANAGRIGGGWGRGGHGCGLLGCRGGCGLLGHGNSGGFGGNGFNPYPNGVPGTLVFPNHPFVRSPRDFFMMDGR